MTRPAPTEIARRRFDLQADPLDVLRRFRGRDRLVALTGAWHHGEALIAFDPVEVLDGDPFAWAVQTEGRLSARPLLTPSVLVAASEDSRIYAGLRPIPTERLISPLYRFLTGGPIQADLVGVGNRTLIACSEDLKIYGIDLFEGEAKWTIATGQPIVTRFAVKPTSSILTPVKGITRSGGDIDLVTKGRHDPCVGIRAVPIGEAMLAIVIADHFLRHRAQMGGT